MGKERKKEKKMKRSGGNLVNYIGKEKKNG